MTLKEEEKREQKEIVKQLTQHKNRHYKKKPVLKTRNS